MAVVGGWLGRDPSQNKEWVVPSARDQEEERAGNQLKKCGRRLMNFAEYRTRMRAHETDSTML